MSFETFQLNRALIEELYQNNLVLMNKPAETSIVETPVQQPYLGKNKKQISILVNNPEVTYLTEDEFNVLSKILQACKLSLDDVAVINLNKKQVSYKQLKENMHGNKVILFGISTGQIELPISFPEFKIQQFDGVDYLVASTLQEMHGESEQVKLLKSKLWVCLKKMFNL